MSDEAHYRREEDRKWRESVESRLVSLTAAQNATDGRLAEHEEHLDQNDMLLEGDPLNKNDNGLKGDVRELGVALQSLRMLMAPDQLGNGGVLARLKALEKRAGIEEKQVENRWKFYTAVAVAIISLIGIVFTNLQRVEPFVLGIFGHPPSVEHHAKKAKPKHRVADDEE